MGLTVEEQNEAGPHTPELYGADGVEGVREEVAEDDDEVLG